MNQTTFNKIVQNIKHNHPHFTEDEIKDGVTTAFNELKTYRFKHFIDGSIIYDEEE